MDQAVTGAGLLNMLDRSKFKSRESGNGRQAVLLIALGLFKGASAKSWIQSWDENSKVTIVTFSKVAIMITTASLLTACSMCAS